MSKKITCPDSLNIMLVVTLSHKASLKWHFVMYIFLKTAALEIVCVKRRL